MDCKPIESEPFQVLLLTGVAVFVIFEVQATGHHYV